jgi:hypothetical protein
MESEIKILRRRIVDMQSELVEKEYMARICSELNLLKRQNSELKVDNRRLRDKIKAQNKDETSDSDSEYYTADEGSDNIEEELCRIYPNNKPVPEEMLRCLIPDKDRTCKYCKKKFRYPYMLKRHFKTIKCGK